MEAGGKWRRGGYGERIDCERWEVGLGCQGCSRVRQKGGFLAVLATIDNPVTTAEKNEKKNEKKVNLRQQIGGGSFEANFRENRHLGGGGGGQVRA